MVIGKFTLEKSLKEHFGIPWMSPNVLHPLHFLQFSMTVKANSVALFGGSHYDTKSTMRVIIDYRLPE